MLCFCVRVSERSISFFFLSRQNRSHCLENLKKKIQDRERETAISYEWK